MARTKEEFDEWFRTSGGDPWDYAGNPVQTRLKKSLEFVRQNSPPRFSGAFVEIGAFNGDFTAQLAKAFPQSRILANDISEIALDQARAKAGGFSNVSFDLSDMLNFRLPTAYAGSQVILVVMEALYYLARDERPVAIAHLLRETGSNRVFISGPIQGERYFNEKELIGLMKKKDYSCVGMEVLNYTETFRIGVDRIVTLPKGARWRLLAKILSPIFDAISVWRRRMMLWRLNADPEYRHKHAHQVIYAFDSKMRSHKKASETPV